MIVVVPKKKIKSNWPHIFVFYIECDLKHELAVLFIVFVCLFILNYFDCNLG
jgi:hypothetical protein